MPNVVINRCFGGFGLSRKAFLRLRELGCEYALEEPDIGEYWGGIKKRCNKREEYHDSFCKDIPRDDPLLIRVIYEMGEDVVSSPLAKLKIVKVPDGFDWEIENYDGMEKVREKGSTWY